MQGQNETKACLLVPLLQIGFSPAYLASRNNSDQNLIIAEKPILALYEEPKRIPITSATLASFEQALFK